MGSAHYELSYLLCLVQEPGRAAYLSFRFNSMWLWQIHNIFVGFLSVTSIGWVPMQLPFLCHSLFQRLFSWSSLLSL